MIDVTGERAHIARMPDISVNRVDLAGLTTADLLTERSRLKIAIAEISHQLMDQAHRPQTKEDDSPPWAEYRAWRKRARWALAFNRVRLEGAKLELGKRHDNATVGRAMARGDYVPTTAEQEAQARARAERLRAVGQATTPEGLLLRTYRLLRHLLPESNGLPPSVDDTDRDTLSLLAGYLRRNYGRAGVKSYVNGGPDDAS